MIYGEASSLPGSNTLASFTAAQGASLILLHHTLCYSRKKSCNIKQGVFSIHEYVNRNSSEAI